MTTTMLAAVHVGSGQVEVRECVRPVPGPGEVLVRVDRAAICGSDLHNIFDGVSYPGYRDPGGAVEPGRPGHEGVGTVVESRSDDFAEGDRVLVLSIGSYAEYMAAPAAQCARLPDGQAFDRMLMAQTLGVCVYGLDRFWPQTSSTARVATVIGAGAIGLHFVQLVKRQGFGTVIVSDLSPERLAAATALGADAVVLAGEQSVAEATMDLTGGEGADLVVEAAGHDATRAEAVGAVRTYGRLGFFGYPEAVPAAFPFDRLFWKSPVTVEVVKGAQRLAGLPTFREAIMLIAADEVNLDHHLGTEFPLVRIGEALEVARERRAIKVQLVP
jgi:L-iditol 2-dehydrogenase